MVCKILATYAASDESPRRGLGTTHTLYPSACRRAVTSFQPEPSAHAPCTSTIVSAELSAPLACAGALAPTKSRGERRMTMTIVSSSERRNFGSVDLLCLIGWSPYHRQLVDRRNRPQGKRARPRSRHAEARSRASHSARHRRQAQFAHRTFLLTDVTVRRGCDGHGRASRPTSPRHSFLPTVKAPTDAAVIRQ